MKKDRTRYKNNRTLRPQVLIGSEGNKSTNTEINYFNKFPSDNRGYTIIESHGNDTDPENIVDKAYATMINKGVVSNDGNYAYVLVDTDTESYKNEQIAKAKKKGKENNIEVIVSSPCFEIWYLSHFESINSHLTTDQVLEKLNKYIPNYQKGRSYYDLLKPNLAKAIENAKKMNEINAENYTNQKYVDCNPHTDVYKIVEKLDELESNYQNNRN